jgi:hypothetical protein
MKRLKTVKLRETQITIEAAARLKRELRGARVEAGLD